MFDFGNISPDRRYLVVQEQDQLILKWDGRILWSRRAGDQPVSIQVTDRGQTCLQQDGTQLFLDRRGQEVVCLRASGRGWFSRDGASYYSYLAGEDGLRRLELRQGATYQPVATRLLVEQALGEASQPVELLCELAGRGVELSPRNLRQLLPRHSGWWRMRHHPSPQAPLEAYLFASPQAFWNRAAHADDWEVRSSLSILLRARGKAVLPSLAEHIGHLPPGKVRQILQTLESEGPLEIGPLRPQVEKIARGPNWPATLAVSVLAKGENLRSCLGYLHTPQGRMVILMRLTRQREPDSIPLLLDLLDKNPQDDWVLQALRQQCRVGIEANPQRWRQWYTSSRHSLEDRLESQSRKQLRGFLLASWSGQLSRQDFVGVPRLTAITPQKFLIVPPLARPPAGWSWLRELPSTRGYLAGSGPQKVCLLDARGRRLTPDRPVRLPGEVSPEGTYLHDQWESGFQLLEMASGRKLPLPETAPRSLAFSPDERSVAVAGPESMRFYELPSGRLQREVPCAKRSGMRWTRTELVLEEGAADYRYHLNGLPTLEALQPFRQRLLGELWTGYRLQGGLPVRLTQREWRIRLARWRATFGPGWEA